MTRNKTERLTLRLTPAQKELLTQAASQAGVTLTEFVTATAEAQTHRALNGETMYLNAEQSRRVTEALLNPGEPNAALRDLFARPGRPEAATLPEQLTIHQAADVLTVTRSHVKSLLAQGQNDHHGEGARLRIDRDALLAYKARDDQERQAVLDELAHGAQEQDHGY